MKSCNRASLGIMNSIPPRLPLVIGVSGHRDLREQDIRLLEQAVGEVIDGLRSDYLCGDVETPLILLSSLAEGADQLVARVAVKRNVKLIAPLPMPPDEYRRDFQNGSVHEALFTKLLKKAVAAPVMPYADGSSLEAIQKDQTKRDLQYREVGVFIVRHCHVLIALWNRDEANTAVGGTTEVVRFKRHGIALDVAETARASLDAPEIGPIICIDTPRVKGGGNVTGVAVRPWGRMLVKTGRCEPFRWAWRYLTGILAALFGRKRQSEGETAELRAWETFAIQTAMTRQFNCAAFKLECAQFSRADLYESLSYLFDDPTDRPAGVAARAHGLKVLPRWCDLYALADSLALVWQKRFQRDWRVLFFLGFAAIVAFEVVTHVDPNLSILFVAYSVIFAAVFIYLWYARRCQHQERYLDYRALAEALRVAVFWKLLGIGTSVQSAKSPYRSAAVDLSSGESVADAYPIRQPRELDWIKTSLRALELIEETEAYPRPEHSPEQEGYSCARNSWVRGQAAFFSKRGPGHDHRARNFEVRSITFLLFSIVVASILFGLERYFHWYHLELRHGLVIFIIGLSAGVAAIFAGYAEKLALNAQARQYDRMRALFERAYELLPEKVEGESFRRAQALFAELGAEAMKENAAWVEIYRQRPIRPP
jgi:hypothetical protein